MVKTRRLSRLPYRMSEIITRFLDYLRESLHNDDQPLAPIAGMPPVDVIIRQIDKLTKSIEKNRDDHSFMIMIQHDFVLCYMNHYPALLKGNIEGREIVVTLGSSFRKPVESFQLNIGDAIRYIDRYDHMGEGLAVKTIHHFLDTCLGLLDAMTEQIDHVIELEPEERLPRDSRHGHQPPPLRSFLSQLTQPETMKSIQEFTTSDQFKSFTQNFLNNDALKDVVAQFLPGENVEEKLSGLIDQLATNDGQSSTEENEKPAIEGPKRLAIEGPKEEEEEK